MTLEKFNKLQSKAWVPVMEHLKYLDSEEKQSTSCKDRKEEQQNGAIQS